MFISFSCRISLSIIHISQNATKRLRFFFLFGQQMSNYFSFQARFDLCNKFWFDTLLPLLSNLFPQLAQKCKMWLNSMKCFSHILKIMWFDKFLGPTVITKYCHYKPSSNITLSSTKTQYEGNFIWVGLILNLSKNIYYASLSFG